MDINASSDDYILKVMIKEENSVISEGFNHYFFTLIFNHPQWNDYPFGSCISFVKYQDF